MFFFLFYPAFAGVVVPAVLVPYMLFTAHVSSTSGTSWTERAPGDTRAVGKFGGDSAAKTHTHNVFQCSLMPEERIHQIIFFFPFFLIYILYTYIGPPCRSGPDVSFSHVQYELIEICGRLAFYKSQLSPDPAQAHSDHPEMGGLD